MQLDDIRTLVTFNQWANRRVVDAVVRLPLDEFTRDLKSSFGSLKGTLVHILAGEWVWLRNFQRKPHGRLPEPDDFPDATAVGAAFPQLEREQRAFLETLTDEVLRAPLRVRAGEFPLERLVQHFVNHSTYHRGQMSTLLRQLDHVPPATDFGLFLHEVPPDAQVGGLPN